MWFGGAIKTRVCLFVVYILLGEHARNESAMVEGTVNYIIYDIIMIIHKYSYIHDYS